MGRQIIKQPNGKYCIYSSIVDNVTYFNMSADEIIKIWVKESKESIKEKVDKIINQLNNGEKPYYQFTFTYDQMIQSIEDCHGKDRAKEIKEVIEKNHK